MPKSAILKATYTYEIFVTYLPAVVVVPATGSSPALKGGRILDINMNTLPYNFWPKKDNTSWMDNTVQMTW